MSKEIWLIRHAESQANAGMKTSYPHEIQLSQAGFEQAERFIGKLPKPPDLIITSPYVRTKQTAGPLIKKHKNVPHEEWEVHEFTYISPDKCHNTTELDRLPMAEEYWKRSDPFYCDGKGAESFADFIKRAVKAIKKLKGRKENFITMFSHGQFIAAMLWVINKDSTKLTSEKMKEYKNYLNSNQLINCDFVLLLSQDVKFLPV